MPRKNKQARKTGSLSTRRRKPPAAAAQTRFGLGSDELERALLTGESRGLLEDNYRILADRPVTYQAGHFFVRHTIAFIEVTGLGKVRVDPYYIGECEGGDYK